MLEICTEWRSSFDEGDAEVVTRSAMAFLDLTGSMADLVVRSNLRNGKAGEGG